MAARALVFPFFDGLGGMALVAGLWSIWHLVSGLALALWWGRRRASDPSGGGLPLRLRP
jgi:BASS family bile acid:Na+ symporter